MCPGPMSDAAGAAAVPEDQIGRATAVAAYLLREATDLGAVEAGLGL
jgi:hypothetical protein